MASVIAVVRLAPGRVGYFDELTRIHLTLQTPQKPVIEGMNTTNLKKAVKSGSLQVVSGSLEPVITPSTPNVAPIYRPIKPAVVVEEVEKQPTEVEKQPIESEKIVEVVDIKPKSKKSKNAEPIKEKVTAPTKKEVTDEIKVVTKEVKNETSKIITEVEKEVTEIIDEVKKK